jgi:hypothetical protein
VGLDNIPKEYPCRSKGTAVLVEDDRIDCKATQAAGGCPWLNAGPPEEGRVLGMFGTDCWYRGKYGNYLLAEVTEADKVGDDVNFYGDNEDGTEKSPDSCVKLATIIRSALDTYDLADLEDEEKRQTFEGLNYAEWYLRWVAAECGGLVCWY